MAAKAAWWEGLGLDQEQSELEGGQSDQDERHPDHDEEQPDYDLGLPDHEEERDYLPFSRMFRDEWTEQELENPPPLAAEDADDFDALMEVAFLLLADVPAADPVLATLEALRIVDPGHPPGSDAARRHRSHWRSVLHPRSLSEAELVAAEVRAVEALEQGEPHLKVARDTGLTRLQIRAAWEAHQTLGRPVEGRIDNAPLRERFLQLKAEKRTSVRALASQLSMDRSNLSRQLGIRETSKTTKQVGRGGNKAPKTYPGRKLTVIDRELAARIAVLLELAPHEAGL